MIDSDARPASPAHMRDQVSVPAWTGAFAGPLLIWAAWWHVFAFTYFRLLTYGDFGRFYHAVTNWRAGKSLYDVSPSTWLPMGRGEGIHLWNLNPPHVSLVLWPLAALPIEIAYALWVALTLACWTTAAIWICRALGVHLSGRAGLLLTAFVLAASPTLSFAATGQLTGPLTLLTTAIWRVWREERWELAAIGIGVALSLKLFFVWLLLYLLWRRLWRPAMISVLTAAACFATGLLVFGVHEHSRWIGAMRDVQWPWLPLNSALSGPITRVTYVLSGGAPSGPLITRATGVAVILAFPVAIGAFALTAKDRNHDRVYFLLLATTLLTFPLGWIYYWWMFAAPLAACLRTDRLMRIAFLLSLPGWLTPSWLLWPFPTAVYAATVGSLYFWSLLALWLGAVSSALETLKRPAPRRTSELRAEAMPASSATELPHRRT